MTIVVFWLKSHWIFPLGLIDNDSKLFILYDKIYSSARLQYDN